MPEITRKFQPVLFIVVYACRPLNLFKVVGNVTSKTGVTNSYHLFLEQ